MLLEKNKNKNLFLINFSKISPFIPQCEKKKCCRAGHATDEGKARSHCILDTQGYRYTLGICNTYFFSTAAMVAGKHLNVTL
jgi:hypothetical protein